MSTPDRFAEGIDPAEMRDGWLGRCLVFLTRGKRPKKERNSATAAVPDDISQTVIAWRNRVIPAGPENELSTYVTCINGEAMAAAPKQIDVPADSEAEQMFISFDSEAEGEGEKEPAMDCLWAKAEENARKIALIVAASENYDAPRITLSVADYSIRLIRYLLHDFSDMVLPNITSSKTEKEKLKIIKVIASSGINGITKSKITRKTQWTDARQRNSYIADLVEANEIVTKPTCGNKGSRFWTTENYNAYVIQQQQA